MEHVNITDPNIHEPKGISSATTGMVYVANGGGSGTWKNLPTGWGRYHDNSGSQVVGTAWTQLLNNGLGSTTVTSYLPTSGNLVNTTTNKITPVATGDLLLVTIETKTVAVGGDIVIGLDTVGSGVASIYQSIVLPITNADLGEEYVCSFTVPCTATEVSNGIRVFAKSSSGSSTLSDIKFVVTRIHGEV